MLIIKEVPIFVDQPEKLSIGFTYIPLNPDNSAFGFPLDLVMLTVCFLMISDFVCINES